MKTTIEKRARDYAVHVSIDELNKEGMDAESFCGILHGYIKGATEQRKIDIDKACEWMEKMLITQQASQEFIEEALEKLKQAMEE